ncbi:hypothetical protein M501DRAFT_919038, partial [Patellaria atrata CBS 101060]
IVEKTGDIFDAPPNSVIIHACNCKGHWGAGIAAAFKSHYPEAHKIHASYCTHCPDKLAPIGTAQLIPPVDGEANNIKHYVGCLYTSTYYGRKKDSPSKILENTGPAMEHLLELIENAKQKVEVGEVRMCKINSGLFKVPWEKTRKMLEGLDV